MGNQKQRDTNNKRKFEKKIFIEEIFLVFMMANYSMLLLEKKKKYEK
jgi:hypothetical protein